jgi:cytochrome c553
MSPPFFDRGRLGLAGLLLNLAIGLALPLPLPLSAVAAPAPTPVPVPDTLAQRLLACAGCHGAECRASRSGYQPRIAGKPAGYLYNQLLNFRAGRRSNEAMTQLIDNLSDGYLREMAQHYAGLDLPYPAPPKTEAPAAVLERGRQLVQQGDAARGLPPCTRCHGTAMTGAQPALPGLLGLPRDYLVGQIGAWQTGLRRAPAPDCMRQIAVRLGRDDTVALAAWLSAQSLPANSHPAPSIDTPLPLDCGSGLR